jgi:hypothetical protein
MSVASQYASQSRSFIIWCFVGQHCIKFRLYHRDVSLAAWAVYKYLPYSLCPSFLQALSFGTIVVYTLETQDTVGRRTELAILHAAYIYSILALEFRLVE